MAKRISEHYTEQLAGLKETVLRMGGLAEAMTKRVTQALVQRNADLLPEVRTMEKQVNQLHIEIDEACLEIIALRQPAGYDLRFITAAMKINTDMERIGDQAINILENAESLLVVPPLKPLIDIPRMAEIAQEMLKDALDAFVNGDDELAQRTVLRDDAVDQLKDQVFRELLTYMTADPSTIPRAMDLILVSRHLERIADHATNICEDVIFMVKGKDIRHQGSLA
ncbi:MAG: transcriptional repressor for high-affinity phosphate uptake (modular protein) [Deltaproteobacteria bacterium]|nr:transcriptional repressor for high-affinity phosphate uptake (modular protein) [Deltaproteobacteria bacterium]